MNKQIVTLVAVVLLGVGAGLLFVSKQGQGKAGAHYQTKQKMSQSMDQLRTSIDELTAEMKALRATIPSKPGAEGARANVPPAEDFNKVYEIPLAHSPVIGKKDAPVTITEFMDFQCPYCARFHAPLEELIRQYPDQVNYVVKNLPLSFHPNARSAAKAALAAGEQGKYAEMAGLLLKNQTNLTEETFKKLAGELGLDVDRFLKDYTEKNAQWEEYINKDLELAAQIGARGTPTFYINGKKTRARTAEQYKEEIDVILKK